MGKDEKEFEHESLQSKRSVIAYLAALQEGFESGRLVIGDPEGRIELKPNGLVRLSVEVLQRRDRVRLELRFEWKNGQDRARAWPLTLKGGGDEG
ncbi:MAG TPA: amphi-Trp domain-containing protein [Candidatus Krumholzibacteria bacterium]|jgi:amphi-Trp domain-containing protein|nr:amphi-Trp domain-containing protein [Candidatus Krumholzibacteria bacterium]